MTEGEIDVDKNEVGVEKNDIEIGSAKNEIDTNNAEINSNRENEEVINRRRAWLAVAKSLQTTHINALHGYNDARDVGQVLLSRLATMTGETQRQVMLRFDVGADD